ncbi:uncharacterized protein LOC144139213 [Haemaphysalis longicornis]
MSALTEGLLLATIVASLALLPHVCAETNEIVPSECFHMKFPDLLNISNCITPSMSMCHSTGFALRRNLERLHTCIMESILSQTSVKVILTFLRALIIFCFEKLFPRAASVLVPILKAVLPKPCKKKNGCNHPLLSENPCRITVDLSFVDYVGVGQCIEVKEFMCNDNIYTRDEIVATLMKMGVCAMRRLPNVNYGKLLKKVLCKILRLLIKWLKGFKSSTNLEPVYDALHNLTSCHTESPINPKAERRILQELQFRLDQTGFKLENMKR